PGREHGYGHEDAALPPGATRGFGWLRSIGARRHRRRTERSRRLPRLPYRCRWRSRLAVGEPCARPIGQFRIDECELRTEHRFFIARRRRRDLIGVRRGLLGVYEFIAAISPKRCPRTSRELRVDERQLGADHLKRFHARRRPPAGVEHRRRRRLSSRRGQDRHGCRAYPRVSGGRTETTGPENGPPRARAGLLLEFLPT